MKPIPHFTIKKLSLALGLCLFAQTHLHAQGTAFSYQGRLNDGAGPATGVYDFQFALANAASGGSQIGVTVTNLAVGVTNGLFATTLDFGSVFTGNSTWLAISVRTNGANTFAALNPLQALMPTPYAIFAGTASNVSGTVSAAQIAGGTIGNSVLPVSPSFSGAVQAVSYTGNGANVTNVNAAKLQGLGSAGFWQTAGNAGTTPAGSFLGTSDNQSLVLKANGQQVMRFDPTTDTANVIGGYSNNVIQAGAFAAVIAGGGSAFNGLQSNSITTSGSYAFLGGGIHNTITGQGDVIVGGSANVCAGQYGGIGSGTFNVQSGANSWIGGGSQNNIMGGGSGNTIGGGGGNSTAASTTSVTIGGGSQNAANATWSTVGGGYGNVAGGQSSVVAGGNGNRAGSQNATIAGGINNQANGLNATVAGGSQNTAGATNSTVSGGFGNTVTGSGATLSGGLLNQALNLCATVPGGSNNIASGNYSFAAGTGAQATNDGTFVWADTQGTPFTSTTNNQFSVRAKGGVVFATSGGGLTVDGLSVLTTASLAAFQLSTNLVALAAANYFTGSNTFGGVVLATNANNMFTGAFAGDGHGLTNLNFSTIPQGSLPGFQAANGYSTVSGGIYNSAGTNATVSGGYGNTAVGAFSTIAGGRFNSATTNDTTVGGGQDNNATAPEATVAGGDDNKAAATWAVVGGGSQNVASNDFAVVSGGYLNFASGMLSTIGGGDQNIASGLSSTVGGGYLNRATAENATIPGGCSNLAIGQYSFAAGYNAQALHDGSFVWSDGNGVNTFAYTNNQFVARASGGVEFLTSTNLEPASYATGSAGVVLLPGATSWTTVSDRNAKKNFRPVDSSTVLAKLAAMPVQLWNYQWENDGATPNIGPMAQDFKAAFYPGRDDRGISTLEFDGVELAAIQGLNRKLDRKEQEIADLQARLAKLEQLISNQNGAAK